MARKPLALLCAALTLCAASPALPDEVDAGRAAYMQFCASCHGEAAGGDGPLGALITGEVPDLTSLSRLNGGIFPMFEVIRIIDGRSHLAGHGGAMPVYGALFDAEAAESGQYDSTLYTRGRILSLAYYLESIQAE